MFGFIIGTACLIGLVRMFGRGRYGRRWGGHRGHFHLGRQGFGPSALLGQLFRRLDTTPEQEKVIVNVVERAKEAARAARRELSGARTEVANALRSESFDEVLLGGAAAKLEAAADALRKQLFDVFAEIHTVLDAHQRSRLADFIEKGRARGARWAEMDDHESPFVTL